MPQIFIIDASGYLYRSYFAIRNITNQKGQSTNALFGFIRSLQKLFNDFKPEFAVAVFDGPKNAESRTALYSDYKAHRASMPPDLLYQIEWARHFCDISGLANLSVAGVEADDTMGSIALWAKSQGFKSYIATSDKDMCQIVDEDIFILNTFKENLILDTNGVKEQFGVSPSQIIDYLSIIGDSSDNVPGIAGLGPKAACDLLNEFGSLDAILANTDAIKNKRRQELILKHKEDALLSQKLVTLNTEVPFQKNSAFFHLGEPKKEELREFYTEMSFHTLLKELSLPQEAIELQKAEYNIVNTREEFDKLIKRLEEASEISLSVEATHPEPLKAEIVGIGFSVQEAEAFYLPFYGAIESGVIISKLKPTLENPEKRIIGHDIKYDYHVLSGIGINIQYILFDTNIASYVLNANDRKHTLEHLMLTHFSQNKTLFESLVGKGRKAQSLKDIDPNSVVCFSCEEADFALRLKHIFQEQIKERKLERIYYEIEIPLIKILASMEKKGIYLDIPLLQKQSEKIDRDIAALKEAIFEITQEEFNLNSPKQLAHILFEKMGIKPFRKKASGPSTDASVLEELKWNYPIAEKLLEYRGLEKLRSTYIEKLPDQVHPQTGRIHCTFNQTVAATGRLSCQDPNLQNIPVRTETGRQIREAFRPEKENFSFISADYSQIELRLMAHLSEDETLMAAFKENLDIHTYTAGQIFNIPYEKVTKDERFQAKAVNFGIMYGQGDFGLSQQLGISKKEASEIIKKYFERYSDVKNFIENSKIEARKTGKATTLTGRERLLPEINSKNFMIRAAAERLAVNNPLQGAQADLIKMAMIKIHEEIQEKNLHGALILQIHDELIFEVPDSEIPLFLELVPRLMTSIMSLKVPLVVDVHIGKNWKEC